MPGTCKKKKKTRGRERESRTKCSVSRNKVRSLHLLSRSKEGDCSLMLTLMRIMTSPYGRHASPDISWETQACLYRCGNTCTCTNIRVPMQAYLRAYLSVHLSLSNFGVNCVFGGREEGKETGQKAKSWVSRVAWRGGGQGEGEQGLEVVVVRRVYVRLSSSSRMVGAAPPLSFAPVTATSTHSIADLTDYLSFLFLQPTRGNRLHSSSVFVLLASPGGEGRNQNLCHTLGDSREKKTLR